MIKMIQDAQEYLHYWEKENNPFYPDEMRWDRATVNTFLKDWKQQCNIADVVGRSEQLSCDKCENGLIWSEDRLKAKSCDCGK